MVQNHTKDQIEEKLEKYECIESSDFGTNRLVVFFEESTDIISDMQNGNRIRNFIEKEFNCELSHFRLSPPQYTFEF